MKVIVDELAKTSVDLELGDVIENDGRFYLVVRLEDSYCARDFKGDMGLFGKYPTMDELNQQFNKRRNNDWLSDAKVYKSSEYSLKLVKN